MKYAADVQKAFLRKCRTFAFEEAVWGKLETISEPTIDRIFEGAEA